MQLLHLYLAEPVWAIYIGIATKLTLITLTPFLGLVAAVRHIDLSLGENLIVCVQHVIFVLEQGIIWLVLLLSLAQKVKLNQIRLDHRT